MYYDIETYSKTDFKLTVRKTPAFFKGTIRSFE